MKRDFRLNRLITAGLFFLVAASAGVECWVGEINGERGAYIASYDLLYLLVPDDIEAFENALSISAPLVWQVLLSTVLQFPLWLLFAIIAVGFAVASAKLNTCDESYEIFEDQIDVWLLQSAPVEALEPCENNWAAIDDRTPDNQGHQTLEDLMVAEENEDFPKWQIQ